MSADGVDQYVKRIVSVTKLPILLASVDKQLASSKSRAGKSFLAELRELCIYTVPGQLFPSAEFALGLNRLIEDSHDPDHDKKVLRVCYFLLFEYFHGKHVHESTHNAVFVSLVSYLQRTAITHLSGSQLCLSWRHLGRLGSMVRLAQGPSDSSYGDITDTVLGTMRNLKYPEKKKGFLGREKISEKTENALHMWTSVFSAARRANIPLTKDCMPIVFHGCMSAHRALSRHGFALLRQAVELNPAEFSPLLVEKLEQGHFFSHASIDSLNCSQLVHACRIMMTAESASTDIIQHALTVIFNLLNNQRYLFCVKQMQILYFFLVTF